MRLTIKAKDSLDHLAPGSPFYYHGSVFIKTSADCANSYQVVASLEGSAFTSLPETTIVNPVEYIMEV